MAAPLLKWMVAAALVTVWLCTGACGKRRRVYSKRLSLSPASPAHTLIERLRSGFERRDLERVLDCFDRESYSGYKRTQDFLTSLFLKADDIHFSLHRSLVSRPRPGLEEYELRWKWTYRDIYTNVFHSRKGRSRLTMSRSNFPRIVAAAGDEIFSDK